MEEATAATEKVLKSIADTEGDTPPATHALLQLVKQQVRPTKHM